LERNREIVRAAKLCLSLIPIVQYDYKRYFDKFISLLGQCQLEDVLDADFLQVVIAQAEMHNEGLPEKGPLEKDRQIRELVLAHYVQVCQNVSVQVTKCWEFEQHLRPFFQAKPNTKAELAHWRKYLEFEEKGGDFERITFLYERCLVTCALYEEFWLRFARWMYDQGKEENTRLIFSRASCIFVSISAPAVRLAWARFEEKLGCVSVARDIYVAILDQKPEHEESMLALANLERRHEGCDAAVLLLEGYVGQSSDQYAGQLVAEQARILAQCKGKVDEARRAFSTKVDQLAASRTFWLQYFQFEISRPCTDQADGHKRVNAVYEEMLAKARLSPKHVKELAYRYMNFLMQCGSKDALDEYLELDQSLNRYVLT
jgi:pre-mRNA-processing factor 39